MKRALKPYGTAALLNCNSRQFEDCKMQADQNRIAPPDMPSGQRIFAGPRQSGFTMVELVVTMIVIGILAAVVVPRFSLLSGFNDVGYRDKVKATLEFARKSAVAQRRNVRVLLSGNSLSLKVELATPEGDEGSPGSYQDLPLPTTDSACGGAANMICAPSNVTITAGPATLTFTSLGRPSAASYTYTVHGDADQVITVSTETGHVH